MGDAYMKEAYQLIYKHPSWQQTVQEYEDRFAANLYHTSYVQEAARSALTKLSSMLTAYYRVKGAPAREDRENLAAIGQVAEQVSGRTPDDWKVLEGALLRDNSAESAGQIGKVHAQEGRSEEEASRINRENITAVMEGDGNLREQMTMLYNGMFLNGGRNKEEIERSQSLKNMLLHITPEDLRQMSEIGIANQDPELANASIPFEVLKEMEKYNDKDDLFDTYSMARDLKRGRDKHKGRGNIVSRWASGIKRALNASFLSWFLRKNKAQDERKGLGLEHYNRLGLGLSQREMANGVVNGELQWKEGQAYFRMKTPVTAEGILQTAGPSGTTLRMLGAYRLLGANKQDLLYFRLALMAWMVSSRDHSVYEILKGSHNAGVKGEEDLSEAATMYKTISPLEEDEIRNTLAPDRHFPHETVYLTMLNELRAERKARRPDLKRAPSLFRFESSDRDNEEDFNALNYDAVDVALNIYTSELYKVMNMAQKHGDIAGRYMLKHSKIDGITRGEQTSDDLADSIYNLARITSRIAQDGLESRGSKESEISEIREFDLAENRRNEQYKAQYADGHSAYRGITYRGGKIPSAYRGNGIVHNQSFLSTSQVASTAKRFCDNANVSSEDKACFLYRLNGKGAVNITSVSMMGGEREVLVPVGTVFRIVRPLQEGYFHRKNNRFKFAADMSAEELAKAREDALVTEEQKGILKPDWAPYQMMELEEVGGPGEARRAKMEAKREKSMATRRRLLANQRAEA